MAVADKQLWKLAEPKISDNDHQLWVLGEPKNILDAVAGAEVVVPTVTTQAVSAIAPTTATGNGNITATGGENCDKRGFVYDYVTHGDPGDTAPAVSDYAKYVEDSNSYGAGTFTKTLIDLWRGAKTFVRAYAHNSAGYAFGGEVSFFTPGGYAVLFQEPAIV